MQIRAAGFSVMGVGRAKNDDCYSLGSYVEQASLTTLGLDTESNAFKHYGLLLSVADGIGGYQGGNVASRMAMETFTAQFYGERRTGCTADELRSSLQNYLSKTQSVLLEVLERSKMTEAGTTFSGIVLAYPDLLVVFSIGDSRVLRYSAGYARQLTVDQTVVGKDVASGRLTEEEAMRVPNGGALIHSLGARGSADAEWIVETVSAGTQFFLGTDGWHGLGRGLTRQDIQLLAREGEDAETMCRHMVRSAAAAGSRDDITVVVVQISEDETR